MSESKGIVWLASYPKSGNTWFRVVLSRLINQSESLKDLDNMDVILGSPMVANRSWMNKALGFDSKSLTDNDIDKLRPDAYKTFANQLTQTAYIKVHDAYTHLEDKTPLFPKEGCLGALYFVRNPLDVAISLAHHVNCPIDWSIHMMGNEEFTIPLKGGNEQQLRQKLLSWSKHVESWQTSTPFKTLVLRYEDLFFNPQDTFTKALDFLKLGFSAEAIKNAIEASTFDKLQQHEKTFGFREKLRPDGQFFRKGLVGDWKNTLSETQIQKVIHDHKAMMQEYGYLEEIL